MVYCPSGALRTVIALMIVIQVLASLRPQTEGFSNFAENESKWKDRSRIRRFARSDLGFAVPVFLYRPTLNKSVWKHHTSVIKRQATYDANIQDLEALVAAEEAKTADAANMAGQPGRGWSDWSPWSTCSIPQPTCSFNFNRHNISANLSQSFPQNNLFNRSYPSDITYNSTSVQEHCHSSENFIHNTLHSPSYALHSIQRSSSVPEQCHSSGSEQVLDDYTPRITTIQSNAPVVQGGYQHTHHSRNISDYSKVRNVDRNQSCTLHSDPTVMPEVDTLEPENLRKGQADFHEDSILQMVKVTDTDYEPTFADLFQSLRAKLNKEREKTTAKVNRLTSIVSESSRCQTTMKGQSPGQFANIPAYGEPCTHAASSPLDPSSNGEPPPRINLSMVLSDQTAINGDSGSDHFSILCRISPDTPRE